MPNGRDHLHRFIQRVHRRLLLLRILEGLGLGMLTASILGLGAMPLLAWRGQSPMPLLMWLLPAGGLVGMTWSMLRQPRTTAVAALADRQLDLADLLSTAWMMRKRTDDPFVDAVLACANDRCQTLAPSSVMLRRLGSRSWGGIGLATSLVLILGLLIGEPSESSAYGGQVDSELRPRAANDSRRVPPGHDVNLTAGRAGHSQVIAADQPGADDRNLDPGARSMAGEGGTGRADVTDIVANPQGAGGGSARSPNAGDVDPLRPGPTEAGRTGDGQEGGGTGAAARNPSSRGGNTGQSAGGGDRGIATEPWRGDGWHAAVESAGAAMRDGRIPSRYHQMVREYFARD